MADKAEFKIGHDSQGAPSSKGLSPPALQFPRQATFSEPHLFYMVSSPPQGWANGCLLSTSTASSVVPMS
jgi:hypothetical protein